MRLSLLPFPCILVVNIVNGQIMPSNFVTENISSIKVLIQLIKDYVFEVDTDMPFHLITQRILILVRFLYKYS